MPDVICQKLVGISNYINTVLPLKPFQLAMLIWEEHLYREKIGLPTLLDDTLDAVVYSNFMNFVTNGHKNPYFEWEKNWEEYNDSKENKLRGLST